MKTVARMALQPGMILGEDIKDSGGRIVFKKNDILTTESIDLMKRYSIICVTILEDIDFAKTHYEKLQYDNGFKAFKISYVDTLNRYKSLMNDFITKGILIEDNKLYSLYHNLRSFTRSGNELLDYLFNLMPGEDLFTYGHLLNSALISGVFSEWLSFSSEEKETLVLCSFYYDIGKLMIPSYLLWKTEKLTREEFELMKNHTSLGFKAVMNTSLSAEIKKSVIMHHERIDGSGYPAGIREDGIDIYNRMLAIVDTYEAMASPRTYRSTIHPLNIIYDFEQHYPLYDSNLLLPILHQLAQAQIGTELRLSDNNTYQVLVLNKECLSRPIVKDENQNIINLMQRPDLRIL